MFFDITSPWRNRASSARVSSPARGPRRSRRKWVPSVERFEERTLLSSTMLSSTLNPSTYGQLVFFTAVVQSGDHFFSNGEISGAVNFYIDGNAVQSQPVSGTGTIQVGYATQTLTPSSYSIEAQYITTDPNDSNSSATLTEVVNPAQTETLLSSSPNPSTPGQAVTFTATVLQQLRGPGTPTGTVDFFDGTTQIGSGTVDPTSSEATFTTSGLAVGGHPITAQYLGDANDVGSTSNPLTQDVQSSTTTALASNPNPSTPGQAVTFTATVTPTDWTGTPTGTVDFFDGTTQIDSETLDPTGTATFTTSGLAVGSHVITAQYLGDFE